MGTKICGCEDDKLQGVDSEKNVNMLLIKKLYYINSLAKV